ncbi:MAG: hypothetical protein NT023_18360 [Armatimonadetes bacterium]|nr:hypothetical protein [Armatimonadota bacterium]
MAKLKTKKAYTVTSARQVVPDNATLKKRKADALRRFSERYSSIPPEISTETLALIEVYKKMKKERSAL